MRRRETPRDRERWKGQDPGKEVETHREMGTWDRGGESEVQRWRQPRRHAAEAEKQESKVRFEGHDENSRRCLERPRETPKRKRDRERHARKRGGRRQKRDTQGRVTEMEKSQGAEIL